MKPNRLHHSNKIERRLKKDFVAFTRFMFNKFGLPEPTPMQLLMADILQKQPSRRIVILAYRGFAKTTIANLYLIWDLWREPTKQFAVWGQNETFAQDSVGQMLGWVQHFAFLKSIAPLSTQKQSTKNFDTPAKPHHMKGGSVNAKSIGAGITGSRADTLLVDDPETASNGYTQQRRENLDRALDEAVMVIKQDTGRIIVLGTPHFDRSLYTRLKAKGYRIFIFPMSVPPKEVADSCWEHYPKQVRDMILAGTEGNPLDRFNAEEISMRMATGKVSYERQCLLNLYRSSGTDRPFDITRIILYDANIRALPQTLEHAREPQHVAKDMEGYSCADLGEKFYRPFKVAETLKPYDALVMYVDPSGAGKDELVFTVAGAAAGYMVLFKVEGLKGGVTRENLERIIDAAISSKVSVIYWESNLNTGAEWCRALMDEKYAPRFGRAGLPGVVPVHQQANKEQRIVATLDPIINGGRMVFTPEAVMGDYLSAQDKGVESYSDYTLTAQISNFTTRDKLPFDDRLDALAGVGAKLAPYLAITPMKQEQDAEYDRLKEILERPLAWSPDNIMKTANDFILTLDQRLASPWRPSRRKFASDTTRRVNF